ncbi:4826_t:CDS:2 [Paraglomus brasilianum]|uniref:4826_t:CDS:1 n=1 Tax=Paraglomus brasilianum TaxID=144538 RepID=A0A9N9DBP2_9GLOM|nr:4826_t:CDS:2 [Paraglomus brasilianum]
MYNNELPVKRNRTQLATNLEKINNWVEYVDDTLNFPVVHASSFSQFVGRFFFPDTPPDEKINDLQSYGFKLSDDTIGDFLMTFEHKLRDIKDDAFALLSNALSSQFQYTTKRFVQYHTAELVLFG